ncbi:creatininase family protein [Salinibaculum rarum]|uniref:creatininase family protein n=1 Tax=Salinibaculum rarum TaxID=3058903 RepID=UPI00265D6591|nr:creatininase family protein [Salinibaculum sp. KK48]
MHLSETAWPDADASDATLAVLPVGSTEQHGPHAPLGTDVLTAEAVAEAGADGHDEDVVLAPPIPVGVAEEHRHFAGTLWVSEDTFRAYVRETIESLASHGWNRVVVVNGHGGNVAPLRELCARLTRDGTAYAVPFTWFDAVDPEDVEMGHGGPVETSLLRHIHPELVDESQFEAAAEDGTDSWGEWQSGTNLAYDTAEFSANGTVGDPGESSAEVGEELLTAASERLRELLTAVGGREWPARED